MVNMIKSLNYCARRSMLILITIISVLALPVLVILFDRNYDSGVAVAMTPSRYFGQQIMANLYLLYFVAILIIACNIMASDADDKTINYEILAGHGRSRIFFARVITAHMWATLLMEILMIIPLGYLDLIYGWGPETDKRGVIIRCLLLLFPTFRFVTFCIMISSLVRGALKGGAICYAAGILQIILTSVLSELSDVNIDYFFGVSTSIRLLVLTDVKEEVINGDTVYVLSTLLSDGELWKTIVSSLVAAFIYMIIAYVNFVRSDRD